MAREAAQRIFNQGFNEFTPFGLGRHPRSKKAKHPTVARWLSELIIETPLPFEYDDFSPTGEYLPLRWGILIDHLDFEFKGFKDKLQDWKKNCLWHERWLIAGRAADLPVKASEIEDKLHNLTFEIMDILNFVGERRTFKGTCEICKDW